MHTKSLGVGAGDQWYWLRGQFSEKCLPANVALVDYWLEGCLSALANDGFRTGLRNTESTARVIVVPDDDIRSAVRDALDHLFSHHTGEALTVHVKDETALTGGVLAAKEGRAYISQGGTRKQIAYGEIANVTKDGQAIRNP